MNDASNSQSRIQLISSLAVYIKNMSNDNDAEYVWRYPVLSVCVCVCVCELEDSNQIPPC